MHKKKGNSQHQVSTTLVCGVAHLVILFESLFDNLINMHEAPKYSGVERKQISHEYSLALVSVCISETRPVNEGQKEASGSDWRSRSAAEMILLKIHRKHYQLDAKKQVSMEPSRSSLHCRSIGYADVAGISYKICKHKHTPQKGIKCAIKKYNHFLLCTHMVHMVLET